MKINANGIAEKKQPQCKIEAQYKDFLSIGFYDNNLVGIFFSPSFFLSCFQDTFQAHYFGILICGDLHGDKYTQFRPT